MQANPGLGGAIPLGLGICWEGTQGRPAAQANPGLRDAIPLGLVAVGAGGVMVGGMPKNREGSRP